MKIKKTVTTMISASSWNKVSAYLYYVAIVVSTFIVPLADVEYISWSEIYKYVGVRPDQIDFLLLGPGGSKY